MKTETRMAVESYTLENKSGVLLAKQKGITLIALVITIIVLVILAGIGIAMLTGENGILTKVSDAKEQTLKSNAKELVDFAIVESLENDSKINYEKLKINLEKIRGAKNLRDKEGNTIESITEESFPLKLNVSGVDVTVESGEGGRLITKIERQLNTPKIPLTGITIPENEKNITIQIGKNKEVNAQKVPTNSDEGLVYTSSNPGVATVNQSGLITAVSGGSTTIIIKGQTSGIEVSCELGVSELPSVTLSKGTTSSTWVQDKTTVTNGTVNLRVGQDVLGYVANGAGAGDWCVLGAESGSLLITTKSNQSTVRLFGKDCFVNGPSQLDSLCQAYKVESLGMVSKVRSMRVEDVDRVCGYTKPSGITYKYRKRNGKVQYLLPYSNSVWEDASENYQDLSYWSGSSWRALGYSVVSVTQDVSIYRPHQWLGDWEKECWDAYWSLFQLKDGVGYWLASRSVYPSYRLCVISITVGFVVRLGDTPMRICHELGRWAAIR